VNGVSTAPESSFPLWVEELDTEIAFPLVVSIGECDGGALLLPEVFSHSAGEPGLSDLVRDKNEPSELCKGCVHGRTGRVSSIDFERLEGCGSRLLYIIQSPIKSIVPSQAKAGHLSASIGQLREPPVSNLPTREYPPKR
jgi:hypothetical protein